MNNPPTRWGICSAGRISSDFSACLFSLPNDEHVIQAVAASSLDRAKHFAHRYQIPQAYGSYEDLAKDTNVDIVYVGSINTKHFEHVTMMLNAGKHVLCEKPMCMSAKDTKELTELAKKKNLFLMEAIWSRFFPAYEVIQGLINDGEIGDIDVVQASFCKKSSSERVFKKDVGGGALYDIGIYTLQLAQLIYNEKPCEISAKGVLNDDGVDVTSIMTLKYPGDKFANLMCSSVTASPSEAVISGSKGFIKIHEPFWCPTKITFDFSTKATSNSKDIEHPLPPVAHAINFVNSQGLTYEAKEVRKCLLEGRIESPLLTHQNSIELSEVLNEIRKQVGYVRPEDGS